MNQTKPFYENDPADTHCLQACFQTAVHRQAGVAVGIARAEALTAYAPNKLTWQYAALLAMSQEFGLHVVDFEGMDPARFIQEPEGVIREICGDEQAALFQIENSDLTAEVARARACLGDDRIQFLTTPPTVEDLKNALASGATVFVNLNGAKLLGGQGYRPHSVIVDAVLPDTVVVDDPGPPAAQQLVVPIGRFLEAWHDPEPSVANFIAVSSHPLAL